MFGLPETTFVNRNIPKNAFESFTNSKQKQEFTKQISKIRWINKLSPETINISGTDIQEIQVFEVVLKQRGRFVPLLDIIDRAIPYPIIFMVYDGGEVMITTAQKHSNVSDENQAVIDWRFYSEWYTKEVFPYNLNLKNNLDFIFKDICGQISGIADVAEVLNIEQLVEKEQYLKDLTTKIKKLESSLRGCKQFNKRVELNLQLQDLRRELEANFFIK